MQTCLTINTKRSEQVVHCILSSTGLVTGLLTGCGQKCGIIVRHYEWVNCAAKNTNCAANCAAVQFLISNVFGGAKWCFDWYSSLIKWWNWYSISWNNVVLFWCQISQRLQYVAYLPEKNTKLNNSLLPVLRNMENKSRQNVCQASCITSELSSRRIGVVNGKSETRILKS